MNIEEAKANIGKEVVYIGSKELAISDFKDGVFLIKEVSNGHIHTCSDKINWVVQPHELQLKQPTFKTGDQVVLDESTKPYTLTAGSGEPSERAGKLEDNRIYTVMGIAEDGDVNLVNCGWIQSRHLKLAPQLKIDGKEVKDFDDSEQVVSNPEVEKFDQERDKIIRDVIAELRKDADDKITQVVNVSNNYTAEEPISRKELAMFLVSSGVPLDDIFKARLDLFIDAIHNK